MPPNSRRLIGTAGVVSRVQCNRYKLYFYKNNPMGYPEELERLEPPQLFDLQDDPSERFNIAEEYSAIVEEIEQMVGNHNSTVVPVDSELDTRIGQ